MKRDQFILALRRSLIQLPQSEVEDIVRDQNEYIADAIAAKRSKLPADQDRAEIQNVPSIALCRQCHSRNEAPSRCTSCHLFHPDKSHWSNLAP